MSCRLMIRNLVVSLLLGAAATLVLCPAGVSRAGDIHNLTEVDQAIRAGAQLEGSRKWLDAIETYEKAVKLHPNNEELSYGLRRSRICFGIERRYTDASFTRSLPGMSRGEALQTFDDVLTKVQGLYVEPITITKFMAHGTETLYWALTDTQFQETNIPVRHRGDVNKLRTILHDKYWNRQVASRAECVQVMDDICRQAQQILNLHAGPVIMEFVFGGCNALDDYSGYLTPSRMRDLKGNINGQFVGLGVEMKAVSGKGLLLVNVIPDSPAEQGGLRAGEHIVMVDGRDVRESTTDQAASLMQGLDGSRVTLGIQGKVRKEPRKVTLTRRAVVVKSIPVAKILDGSNGVGYIQMTGFQSSTAEELDVALRKLNSEGMRALIWDVRGNPGGLLQTAVQVLDRFIGDGVVVSTKGRASDQNHVYPAYRTGTWNLPMVLLVDGDSASASEIVAGAIRDHRRGTLVGRRTFGKWSVQSIYDLMGGGGLRITTAKFYSPNGKTYGKIGVEPDVVVDLPKSEGQPSDEEIVVKDLATDPDILKGVEILRDNLAAR